MDHFADGCENLMSWPVDCSNRGAPHFNKGKKQLINVCSSLSQRITIPQNKEKIELINNVGTDDFWQNSDILDFEKARIELRSLIKFIVDEGGVSPIYTNLNDIVLEVKEGEGLDPAYTFETIN